MKVCARIIVVLLVGLSACSSNKAAFPPQGDIYQKQQLELFLEATGQNRQAENEYIIGVGDHLDIVFPLHEELTTLDLTVRYDGRISLPYIDDARAAGLTPMQLDSILTRRFADILKTPELSVIVRSAPERLIYVIGEVRESGGFPAEGTMSIVQAIALAGGFDKGAKQNNVVVIRRLGLNRVVGVEVDVEAILEGKALDQDFILKDFDIVFVPKTRIQSVADFAQRFREITEPPFSLVARGWQIVNLQAAFEFYRSDRGP